MSREEVTGKKINLFEEFPTTSADDWKKQIIKDLRGADYDKKLVWNTFEGFCVEPFYTEVDTESLSYLTDATPGDFPFVRGNSQSGNNWEICEEITGNNVNDTNELARIALNKGADSITFSGETLNDPDELSNLLKDIPLAESKLNFKISLDSLEIFSRLIAESGKRNIKSSKLSGVFYLSPLNELLVKGSSQSDSDDFFQKIKDFISEADSKAKEYKTLSVDSESFILMGSNIVQELAFSVAMGCEYMVNLKEKGLEPEFLSTKMVFQFTMEPNYFMEIAKLRAARLIWAMIMEKFNHGDKNLGQMTIHCKTSKGGEGVEDQHLKMLRDTLEAMAAIIGGCDTLIINPYQSKYESGLGYSDRLARNTQLVLREEAYLDKIIDPGSGSYYIEKLTDILAKEALELFKDVEQRGGFVRCLENSFIHDQIKMVRNSGKKHREKEI